VIEDEKLVALDIETSDGHGMGTLEPRNPDSVIALVQLAYEDGTIEVRDWNKETHDVIQTLIDEDYRFLIHQAAFELDWFRVKTDLRFKKVWCTMIASQVLNAGKRMPDEATRESGKIVAKSELWKPLLEGKTENITLQPTKSRRFSHALQPTVHRYANGAIIKKDQAVSDWLHRPLSDEQLRYAEDDVRYMIEVARNQWKYIQKFNLEDVIDLEMKVVFAVVDIKHRGVQLDKREWSKLSKEYGIKSKQLEKELNKRFGDELAEREGIKSLFGTYITKSFKVSSPKQLADFFGVEKATEQVLRAINHPLIKKLLSYKEASKLSSTYGKGYIDLIWPDGRIHSLLIQAETTTGRFSSRKPNLQNIPPWMLKSLLTTDTNKLMILADYSSVESRILAYASKDTNFIDSVNSQDVHWENAKKVFNLPDNAKKTGVFSALGKLLDGLELRRIAKGVSFGIPYGISAIGLVSRGFAEDADQGQDLINSFLAQYPRVNTFLKQAVFEAFTRGYTQDIFGRIRWYELPSKLNEAEYRRIRSGIARQAQNHKIQSMSANITKQALVDLLSYFNSTDYGYIVLTVHDSIICEVYKEYANEAIPKIKEIMELAAKKVFPEITAPVDLDVGQKEKRVCRVTGLPFTTYSHKYDFKSMKLKENNRILEPRVEAILLKNNIDTTDFTRCSLFLKSYVSDQSEDWRKEHHDIVEAV